MKIAVFCALGLLIAILLFIWVVGRIRYRVGSRQVKVLLFGVPIRRIAIENIEAVSKRRTDGWAEHWWSTFRPKHRLLVLRRRRGLIRNVVITPKNRYVFKTDLERAIQRLGRSSPSPDVPLPNEAPSRDDDLNVAPERSPVARDQDA